MIRTWRLKKPVTIHGKDWFGKESSITMVPHEGSDWWWNGVKITSEILVPIKRGVSLSIERKSLQEFEHYGVLRYFGLQGVLIIGSGWPPHFGRALDVWAVIQPMCEVVNEPLSYVTVKDYVHWNYETEIHRYTSIQPINEPLLVVKLYIEYVGIGALSRTYTFPNDVLLGNVLTAYTQGWPRWLRYGAIVLDKCGWPHYKTVQWAEGKEEYILDQFALHRLQDLLGVLSVLCRGGMFTGIVTSHCSGHLADINVVKAAKTVPL